MPTSAGTRGPWLARKNSTSPARRGCTDGNATVTERKQPQAPATPGFEGRSIRLPRYDLQPVAQGLTRLLRAQQLPIRGDARVHPEVHPQLRFVVRDQQHRDWNATYDLASGKLGGQLSESSRDEAVIELFEAIHKQHHYPPHTDATSYWAMFADLTALTLIVWAGTGIAMWWQMRKLRRSGALIIAVAIGVSGLILASTARELRSAPAEER